VHYIGLDVHSKHFTAAVVDEQGRLLFRSTHPTSEHNLIEVVTSLQGRKRVAFEETTVAGWVYRTLRSVTEDVIVTDPRLNQWISRDADMDDDKAALRLANLARGNFVQRVHHTDDQTQAVFKELVLGHKKVSKELARAKNQLKAKFRQHGIVCDGDGVYSPAHAEDWLAKLKDEDSRFQARRYMRRIGHLTEEKQAYARRIAKRARAFPQIAAFEALPGIGIIRAATFFAIIDTPHRFANKRKLWTYCGLGLAHFSSDQMRGPVKLNPNGNRMLKELAKNAAQDAVRQGNNPFARHYQRLLANGVKSSCAMLTVARAIVATMWAMWRKDETYIPRAD